MLFPGSGGAFWVVLALAVPKVVGAALTIGLRRYLGPSVSGTFDLAFAPYKFLDNFRNFGTGPALIYEKQVSRALANTAWTLNVLAAIVVTIVAQILAGPIAQYYGHPHVGGLLRLLSIGYVFASIASVHFSLLLRDLDFRARSVPALGQVVVAGCIAVIFAVWGFGVGALVARELTSISMGAVLLWAIYPFRPRPRLVPALARQLFGYSAWVGAGVTALFVSQNVDIFIGGHVIHRTRDIGFYTTSWTLAFLVASGFMLIAGTVVFPTLSRLQDDRSTLTEKLLAALRQEGLVLLPVAGLLASIAPVIIVPLLGAKFGLYRDSFLVLSVLAVYAGNRTMLAIFFEGYKAIGKPWLVLEYNLVKLAVMAPAMAYGAQHGILGLALIYVPIQAVEIPAALVLARRVLGISPFGALRAIRTPVVATFFMCGIVIVTEMVMLGVLHAEDGIVLGTCLLLAGPAYLAGLLILDRQILIETRMVLQKGL